MPNMLKLVLKVWGLLDEGHKATLDSPVVASHLACTIQIMVCNAMLPQKITLLYKFLSASDES